MPTDPAGYLARIPAPGRTTVTRALAGAMPARRVTGQVVPIGAPWDCTETVALDIGEYRRRMEEALRQEALVLMECHPRLVRTFALALLVVYRRAGFE